MLAAFDVVAFGALLVAVIVGVHGVLVDVRQRGFEEETRKERHRDRQRALVRAEYRDAYLDKNRQQWKFCIVNDGPGHAWNITVAVDNEILNRVDPLGKVPKAIAKLGPRASVSTNVTEPTRATVIIRWIDDAEEPGVWESEVK